MTVPPGTSPMSSLNLTLTPSWASLLTTTWRPIERKSGHKPHSQEMIVDYRWQQGCGHIPIHISDVWVERVSSLKYLCVHIIEDFYWILQIPQWKNLALFSYEDWEISAWNPASSQSWAWLTCYINIWYETVPPTAENKYRGWWKRQSIHWQQTSGNSVKCLVVLEESGGFPLMMHWRSMTRKRALSWTDYSEQQRVESIGLSGKLPLTFGRQTSPPEDRPEL